MARDELLKVGPDPGIGIERTFSHPGTTLTPQVRPVKADPSRLAHRTA